MSQKEELLNRIRKHTLQTFEMPDLQMETLTYADKLQSFQEVLKQMGGEAVVLQPGEELDQVIRRLHPDAQRIASNLPQIRCATFNPDEVADPRELDGTDVAVVQAEFGVVENGAVWLPARVKYKALYFIPTALVILLQKEEIVSNMYEAYRRLAAQQSDYAYGVFMSGPSKTADIEQALVFGAHGPMRVTVILTD